jgi:hypothetical protein
MPWVPLPPGEWPNSRGQGFQPDPGRGSPPLFFRPRNTKKTLTSNRYKVIIVLVYSEDCTAYTVLKTMMGLRCLAAKHSHPKPTQPQGVTHMASTIVTSYDWESDTWTTNGDTAARQAWRQAVTEIAEKAKATLPECNGRVVRRNS